MKIRSSPCLRTRLRSTSYTIPSASSAPATASRLSAEHVQVDVGAMADVAGERAADQPGPERPQNPHQAQGFDAHFAQVFGPRSPSCSRAKHWIWSRISRLLGRSCGLTHAAADALGRLSAWPESIPILAGHTSAGQLPRRCDGGAYRRALRTGGAHDSARARPTQEV